MGSHTVTSHPPEVTFPPFKAGTRFIDPGGMQGWVYLVGLVSYQDGIPAKRHFETFMQHKAVPST